MVTMIPDRRGLGGVGDGAVLGDAALLVRLHDLALPGELDGCRKGC